MSDGELRPPPDSVSASVVIPAFTFDRWHQIVKAVEAVQVQSRLPIELILCIDRNPDLQRACDERWGSADLPVPVRVIPNHNVWVPRVATDASSDGVARGYGGGSARNAGSESAIGDVIVTFDDDAWPEPDCLEKILAPYVDEAVVAVGGKTVPDFETQRPKWFPRSFDWIFGCAYEGLPTTLAPTPRLIGANMSVRSTAFHALGGFKSVDFDDLDLCTRLAFEYTADGVLYEPQAVAHHYVPAKRVTWHYFWTRNFLVNRDKVPAFATMGAAASLAAERSFVLRTIRNQFTAAVRGVFGGRPEELQQFGAVVIGIGLAGLGNLVGRIQLWREQSRAG